MHKIQITECPRDAMQGIKEFIPTNQKISYLNALLKVGFEVLDFGSFVSPKAIPQLKDTAEVLGNLELDKTQTKLLAIVANLRGAQDAAKHKEIKFQGFPFSVSETFQKRNTNKSIAESLEQIKEIRDIAHSADQELLVYLSMGFGNPYGDEWSPQIVLDWAGELSKAGIKSMALADTIGVSNPENIDFLFKTLIPGLNDVKFGAHLHTTPNTWREKVEAAFNAGCFRFDSAIKGYGGCPMAKDDLTGNMPTEKLLTFAQEKNLESSVNMLRFETAVNEALHTFPI